VPRVYDEGTNRHRQGREVREITRVKEKAWGAKGKGADGAGHPLDYKSGREKGNPLRINAAWGGKISLGSAGADFKSFLWNPPKG